MRRNNSIAVLKQDKERERGLVILDKTIYVENCLYIPHTNQVMKLGKNPNLYESKIQRTLRKIKNLNRGIQMIYPTSFNADRFYETAKIHKIDRNYKVDSNSIQQWQNVI